MTDFKGEMNPHARKVLDALLNKPHILYEVLWKAHEELLVAGPWEEEGRVRYSIHKTAASIHHQPDGNWQWQIYHPRDGGIIIKRVSPSKEEAQDAADTKLKEEGWILA